MLFSQKHTIMEFLELLSKLIMVKIPLKSPIINKYFPMVVDEYEVHCKGKSMTKAEALRLG